MDEPDRDERIRAAQLRGLIAGVPFIVLAVAVFSVTGEPIHALAVLAASTPVTVGVGYHAYRE